MGIEDFLEGIKGDVEIGPFRFLINDNEVTVNVSKTKQDNQLPGKYCPKCTKYYNPTYQFCPLCGIPLS